MWNRIFIAGGIAVFLVLVSVLLLTGVPWRNVAFQEHERRLRAIEGEMQARREAATARANLRESGKATEGRVDGAMKGSPAGSTGDDEGLKERVAALEARLEATERTIRDLSEAPTARSRADLASKDPGQRREGLKALKSRARDDAEARKAVLEMLGDPDPQVRAEALRSLRDILDDETVPRVMELLGDASPEVRREAIKRLSESGVTGSAPAIAEMLADQDPRVRQAAAAALGDLGARDHAPALLKALDDADPGVKGEAILAVGKLQDPAVIDQLRSRYAPGQGETSLQIALALKNLGDSQPYQEEVRRLVDAAQNSEDEAARVEAMRVLARNAPEEAREILNRASTDASSRVRKEAEKALRDAEKKKR
jgi:HEAT repeat protein